MKREVDKELPRVIRHVCETWEKKKGAKYPFQGGKHGKMLKWLCGIYEHAGVMALWDCYLRSDDEFYQRTGYTIEVFRVSIPKLVDGSWKSIKQKYEVKSGMQSAKSILMQVVNQ